MAKRMPPIQETLAVELFNHFIDFIDEHKAVPLERAFWVYLVGKGLYTADALPESTYRYHFGRLIQEGYIAIEPYTRSLKPMRNIKIIVDRDTTT